MIILLLGTVQLRADKINKILTMPSNSAFWNLVLKTLAIQSTISDSHVFRQRSEPDSIDFQNHHFLVKKERLVSCGPIFTRISLHAVAVPCTGNMPNGETKIDTGVLNKSSFSKVKAAKWGSLVSRRINYRLPSVLRSISNKMSPP